MIRVLHVLNKLGSGGAESFLMNMYRMIDKEKVQFDFLIRSDQNGPIVDEIISMGGRIYQISDFPRHFIKNRHEVKLFFKNHKEYNIVHVHANSLVYITPLKEAKNAGISNIILHSHNANSANLPFLKIIHMINKKRISDWISFRFACSDLAGRWMYDNNEFSVIYNGISLEKFSFSHNARSVIRKLYSITDEYVIGNVGRMSHQKNHKFILNVFADFVKIYPNSKLLLIGEGELFLKMQSTAKKLNISDKVIFTGAVNNVYEYLSAMDVFFLPSFYEGFPVAYVEAQSVGLPCVVSDTITPSATIQDNCCRISLDAPKSMWIKALKEADAIEPNFEKMRKLDSRYVAKKLEQFYINIGNKMECKEE